MQMEGDTEQTSQEWGRPQSEEKKRYCGLEWRALLKEIILYWFEVLTFKFGSCEICQRLWSCTSFFLFEGFSHTNWNHKWRPVMHFGWSVSLLHFFFFNHVWHWPQCYGVNKLLVFLFSFVSANPCRSDAIVLEMWNHLKESASHLLFALSSWAFAQHNITTGKNSIKYWSLATHAPT